MVVGLQVETGRCYQEPGCIESVEWDLEKVAADLFGAERESWSRKVVAGMENLVQLELQDW